MENQKEKEKEKEIFVKNPTFLPPEQKEEKKIKKISFFEKKLGARFADSNQDKRETPVV